MPSMIKPFEIKSRSHKQLLKKDDVCRWIGTIVMIMQFLLTSAAIGILL